jgi:hypothetical protein
MYSIIYRGALLSAELLVYYFDLHWIKSPVYQQSLLSTS